MAQKFYAVRSGRKPGIYLTWAECQEQTNGFKGAMFKGCKTEKEAQEFMSVEDDFTSYELISDEEKEVRARNSEKLAIELSFDKGTVVVITDGSNRSYNESTIYGYGFVAIKDGEIIHKGKGAGNHPDYVQYRNIAGELSASMRAIYYALKEVEGTTKIVVIHDYTGVGDWANGLWKAKNKLSREYVTFIQKIKDKGVELVFNHVKGHTDSEYNEMADNLASEGIDDFIASLESAIS